jgi:hypothetical protein
MLLKLFFLLNDNPLVVIILKKNILVLYQLHFSVIVIKLFNVMYFMLINYYLSNLYYCKTFGD